MQLSISDKALFGVNLFENLHLLSQHGFTHIHLSHKWATDELFPDAEVEEFQKALEKANLKVLDVHGPHPNALDFGTADEERRAYAFEIFRRRLQITHRVGGDAMVYHVPTLDLQEGFAERFIDGLERVEEEARSLGIVIALENHYKAAIDKLILPLCFEKFDAEYIGFTFDPGHANISGNTPWIVANCMERLSVLHLNDNDAKGDKHWNPYQAEGSVPWEAVVRGIALSPYTKPIQLEVSRHEDKHATLDHFLSTAFENAVKIQKLIEEQRKASATPSHDSLPSPCTL